MHVFKVQKYYCIFHLQQSTVIETMTKDSNQNGPFLIIGLDNLDCQ